MARPLRIDHAGGWYHLTARGNERRRIYRDDSDRSHFLELLEELVARFRWRLHVYVLMDNHYHLMVETPEGNLSAGMHWLQVSYSVWFNRRHNRVGHLFQGRFKAIVLDPDTWGVALSHYIHLNPARVVKLGLGKVARTRQRLGIEGRASSELIAARLEVLNEYGWSSYHAYIGLAKAPSWLETGWLLSRMGGDRESRQRHKYRQEAEALIGENEGGSPWDSLEGGILLGAKEWVEQMRREVKGNEKEQREVRALKVRPNWKQVVKALEAVKGEKWDCFRDRHGDWGRDLALLLGRRECGLKLGELGELCGGLDYRTVGSAVTKAIARVGKHREFQKAYASAQKQLTETEQ
jgi:putative transposase